MRIKLHWTRESQGVTEMEVDEAEVLAWVNDPKYPPPRPVTEVTAELVKDFLDAGDGQELEAAIDFDRDVLKEMPWYGYDVESVEVL